jgi:serine phosphatase RsbU (regulator of sigma subunit)
VDRGQRAAALGAVVLLILTGVDILAGLHSIPAVLLTLVPLSVALIAGSRDTALVAVLAVPLGVAIAVTSDSGTTARWVLSICGVAGGGALAVWLAHLRTRAQEQAERLVSLSLVERQLTSALGALGEAVTVSEGNGRIVYLNQAAVDLLRVDSAAEVIAAEPGEIMSRFAVYDEAGRPIGLGDLPGSRLLSGARSAEPLLVRNVVRATGEERWLLNKATLVPVSEGSLPRVANVIEDLTAIKRAELRQRLLAHATRELTSSLDHQRTLQRVAEVVVPDLADWCSVSLPGEGATVETVAVAHSDPDRVRLALELQQRYPNRLDDDTHLAAVLRGEAGTDVADIPPGAMEAFAADADHLRLLEAVGFGSILIVPLDAGGRRLGAMVLVRSDPLRRFGDEDVELAEDLAGRAATALLNAQLYGDHQALAATLQRGMLPPQLPVVAGWSAAALYHPAGEIGEVGGDFYDAFRAGEDWMVVIGDVTGHGPEAATLTALARHTLRTAAELTGDPAAALEHLNRSLRRERSLALCTAACVRISTSGTVATAAVASAGHPLPLLVRDGAVRETGRAGPLAGAFDDEGAWPVEVVQVRAGDVLVLYTDGVLDALSHRGRRGDAGVHALLRRPPATAQAMIRRLDAALAAEPDERRRDDTAAVVLEFLGARVPEPA